MKRELVQCRGLVQNQGWGKLEQKGRNKEESEGSHFVELFSTIEHPDEHRFMTKGILEYPKSVCKNEELTSS